MANKSRLNFSLLEIMVAVSVVGIIFSLLLGGFGNNLRTLGVAEDTTLAVALARDKWIEALNEKELQTGNSQGEFADKPGFRWELQVDDAGDLPLYTCLLKVFYTRRGSERVYELAFERLKSIPPRQSDRRNEQQR